MTLTLENTSRIIEVNGVPARVWEGRTERGTEVIVLITRIAVHRDQDQSAFEAELLEQDLPRPASGRAMEAFPARLVL